MIVLTKGTGMDENLLVTTSKRNVWIRALFMVLMAFAFQVCGTLLFVVAVLQLIIALLNDAPNARLLAFGRALGRYLQQVTCFLTFASEDVPFPFSDWPSGE